MKPGSAASFLAPDDAFERETAGRDPSRETAAAVAGRFHVSREVIYRMFLDRGLIAQSEYDDAARIWAADRKRGEGGDYYNNQIEDQDDELRKWAISLLWLARM